MVNKQAVWSSNRPVRSTNKQFGQRTATRHRTHAHDLQVACQIQMATEESVSESVSEQPGEKSLSEEEECGKGKATRKRKRDGRTESVTKRKG